MTNNQQIDIKGDSLRSLFETVRENLTPESKTIYNNLTDIFEDWLEEKVLSNELIVIQIRGEVRTNKSTSAFVIAQKINSFIAKIGRNPKATTDFHKRIFSDQIEFLRFINQEERDLVIGIDEFSALGKTGANSTTEEALFAYYSDVFAGRRIHRVCCSTDTIIDKNTTILLETGMGMDDKLGITRLKLIYRDIVTKQQLVLGHIDVDASETIKNWISRGVREIVETKGIKSEEDRLKIKPYLEKDSYVKYQVKKYKKMMLLKEGSRDIRDLEFSTIIIEVIKRLSTFSKFNRVDKEMVNLVTDEVIRKNERIYSFVAKNEIAQKASAILSLNTKIQQMNSNKEKMRIKLNEENYNAYMKGLMQLEDMLKERMEEQYKLVKVLEKYLNVDEASI